MKKINILLLLITITIALPLAAQIEISKKVTDQHFHVIEEFSGDPFRKEIQIPNILGYKTIKGDFHTHTIYSDGNVTPSLLVNEAWRDGLDALAITDHNYLLYPGRVNGDYNTSYEQALPVANSYGLTLVKSVEYTDYKPVGHFNFLFIGDANQYDLNVLKAKDAIGKAKEAVEIAATEGAFVLYNHPGSPEYNSDLVDSIHVELINKGMVHGVEVANGTVFYPKAVEYCTGEYGLAPFAGTDTHSLAGDGSSRRYHRNLTLVFAKENSIEAIKDAMFARRTVAWSADFLSGKQEYLSALFKGSISVSRLAISDKMITCHIKNSSDVTYTLEDAAYSRIVIPAHRTIILTVPKEALSNVYRVTNLFIGNRINMVVPLSYLITDNSKQVDMPYITKDISFFNPAEKIYVKCYTDGATLRYTVDGSEPNDNSPICNDGIILSESATLSIRAFKDGYEPSHIYRKRIISSTPKKAIRLTKKRQGVRYDYYHGAVTSVYQLQSKCEKIDSGVVPYFDISMAKHEDHFGFDYYGYIYVPESGVYEFTLRSDDGSVLIIGGEEIVNNDGSHGVINVSSKVNLKEGYHTYYLKYMDDTESQSLQLYWKKPSDNEKSLIPKDIFFID